MNDFTHHPDGRINIQGNSFPMSCWGIFEPDYLLPSGYIGRLFIEGQLHHLIKEGNNTYDQADIYDPEIAAYVGSLPSYQESFTALLSGAHVENVEGTIVISGPPALGANKTEIANDSTEQILIACDLGDTFATDEIRWTVTAPDGTVIPATDNAIAGQDNWMLTTSHVGTHLVRVETDRFGSAEITFEGV